MLMHCTTQLQHTQASPWPLCPRQASLHSVTLEVRVGHMTTGISFTQHVAMLLGGKLRLTGRHMFADANSCITLQRHNTPCLTAAQADSQNDMCFRDMLTSALCKASTSQTKKTQQVLPYDNLLCGCSAETPADA